MLETHTHQASGLVGLADQPHLRIVAVVNHGDLQAELPLLWRLCTSWLEMGERLIVLDGSKAETTSEGGLLQALSEGAWPANHVQEMQDWSIIPSHSGLQQLRHEAEQGLNSLQLLSKLIHHNALVVIYARVQDLGPLFCAHPIRPLLVVSARRDSTLSAYAALKQLLVNNRLEPVIVNVLDEDGAGETEDSRAIIDNLRSCAVGFLGYQVRLIPVAATSGDVVVGDDLEQLACRLVEQALKVPDYRQGNFVHQENDHLMKGH